MDELQKLIEIMARLRSADGCPWDKEQTEESLKPYLIEEAYEVLEAIEDGSPAKLREELGDLLFQIVFQCQLASEKDHFSISEVITGITNKIINRHPHVFGNMRFQSSEEVKKQWHDRKKEEGKFKESILDGVPKNLPSLLRSQRFQSRASKVGFDWANVQDVLKKVDEELAELKDAVAVNSKKDIEEELGDVLFVLVNVSRFAGINAEEALKKTNNKFISRFKYIEKKAAESGKDIAEMSLEELDCLWEEAKFSGLKSEK
jgi:tetrapyrrole methylase family protein/MazG family protein